MTERVLLAEAESRAEFEKRLREKLPALADRLDFIAPDRDREGIIGAVLATRRLAQEFIAAHPDLLAPEFDCTHVEVLSSPYIAELLDRWPNAVFVEANDDVREGIDYIIERRKSR